MARGCVFLTAAIIALILMSVSAFAVVQKEVTTIAVIQFRNLTKDSSVDWLGAGFAETLSTKLSNVIGFQLVERNRLQDALKELKLQSTALVNPASARKLGMLVGAQYLVVGSYQKVGDTIKADVRRIDVETSAVAKGVDVIGPYSSVLDLQSQLAVKLINLLGRTISIEESQTLSRRETISLGAYEWNARGTTQFDGGEYGDAIVSFTKALSLDQKYAAAYNNRGLAHYSRQDLDSAIGDYTRAIQIDHEYTRAYNNRGVAYDDKSSYDAAIIDFEKAIALEPKSPEVLNNRATSYKNRGDYDRAMADYCAAIDLRPKDALLYYNRGNLHFCCGKMAKAHDDYTITIELEPDNAQAYNNRGSVHNKLRDVKSALDDFQRAIDINPRYATPHFNRAIELEAAGRRGEALTAYRRFVALATPEQGDQVQNALEEINKLSEK